MQPENFQKPSEELGEVDLERASGGRRAEWTDSNIHDPGITKKKDARPPRLIRPFEPDL